MWSLLVILIIKIIECCCHSYNDERLLINYLFSGDRYNKDVRPVLNSSMPVVVNISFTMYALAEMNVADKSVCGYGSIAMEWIDEVLTWNATDYGGIRTILAPSRLYWRPHIALDTNHAACDDRQSKVLERVSIHSNGTIKLIYHGYIGTSCIVDVKLFPFDHHVCAYRYFDFSHDTTELTLQLTPKLDHYKLPYLNEEWEVFDIVSSLYNVPFSGNKSWTTIYECTFNISRRPGYIVIHNIIPAGFVILLSVFVPFIPPDTGERLSYAITTYLATVFMTVSFYDNIPKNSLCITLISYNLIIYYAISSIGLIWSIGIVCLSRQTVERLEIPKCITILLGKTKSPNTTREPDIKSADCYSDKNNVNEEVITETVGIIEIDNYSDKSTIGWYEVSRYLDKLFFVFNLMSYICLVVWNVLMATNENLNTCQSFISV